MSGAGSSTRSDSLQSRLLPRDPASDSDSCLHDTALPPMSSKQLAITGSNRPLRGSEPSMAVGNLRGNSRAAAVLGCAPDSMSNTIARGPSTHRRTGSTLRTVMKKIFTRKRGSQPDGLDPDFRFSNPQTNRSEKVDNEQSYAISSSLRSKLGNPHKELDDHIALSDALDKLESRPPRRRRATLPSLIFSDESRDALDALIHSDHRAGHHPPPANPDPDDRRREILHLKRRSRSAGALRGMSKNHRMSPIQWRRRSMESYMGSTAGYAAPSESEYSVRPPTQTTIASIQKPSEPSMYEEVEVETESIAPNVGTLVNTMQHDENVTLEQRLTTLEVKLIDLEFAIARMQVGGETTSAQRKPSENNTARRHRRKQSAPRTHTPPRSASDGSVDPILEADRPSSTGTIRASAAANNNTTHRSRTLQPPISSSADNGISVEQYSALVMLLRREQSARRNLEGEVSGLRSDIQQLQQIARDSMGLGPASAKSRPPGPIPIPSPGPSPRQATMQPTRSTSQEFLRIRQAIGRSPTTSAARTDKPKSPFESEDWEREMHKEDMRARWQANRRVEVGGMI